ncbi:MAG TPA: protein kinase [Isosphaeraceae bacterium]
MSTSSEARDYGRFDELAEEFAERYRRGERPSLQEYVDRLPEMADEIREMFPALVEVEQAEGDAREDAIQPPPRALPRQKQVGDYRIVREVGRGGMGVVYEAEQVSLGRRVALKVLTGHVAADRKALQRFSREAKAAARLHHTNIVPVFEVGRDGDVAFYAMQFIQGQGLDQIIRELRRLPDPGRKSVCDRSQGPGSRSKPASAPHGSSDPSGASSHSRLGRVAESLLTGRLATDAMVSPPGLTIGAVGLDATEMSDSDESWKPGLPDTLGDSPGNRPAGDVSSSALLPGGTAVSSVESSGRRIPFFRSVAQLGRQAAQGLAHAHTRGVVHRDIKPSNLLLDTAGVVWIADFGLAKAEEDGLTATGDVLGTLRYMAPERFRGGGDSRADIYALGLTLYELMTLRPGFETSDRLELVERIKAEEPPRPRSLDARIPRDLETIVLKAIDKDPERRYATAEVMAEDLRRFLDDEPILARRATTTERYARWARRNPHIAALGGLLAGVLVLVTIGSLLAARSFRTQAQVQRSLANAREIERLAADRARAEEAAARDKADRANADLLAAQEALRRTVYATRSNLALAAWDNNDVGRLRSLIDLLRAGPGEPDSRGWEWRYLWQLAHGDRLTLRAREDIFADVAFSPDGQTLAGLEKNGRIQLWDRHTGESRRTTGVATGGRTADLAGGVHAVAFSPDGRSLAGPGPDESLVLYAVDTGLPRFRFQGDRKAMLGLAWSPDGRTIVAALSTHVMRAWDARDGRLIHNHFGWHNGPVTSVAFSPDGRTIASASFDRTVKLWNPEDPVNSRAVLNGHVDEVSAVAFSPDGRRVLSASHDRSIRVWDAGSGAGLAVIWGHTGSVTSVAYLPDGVRAVTGSADETVRIWDTASGQELRWFKGHSGTVAGVAVSPDGRDVASASLDRTVRLWDAADPPHPRTLQSPSVLTYGGALECLAFGPDGRRLASGHDDHALRVWDLRSDRPPRVLKGHGAPVRCVAFSPDGRILASGSKDRTARLWDVETGEPRITFTGHTDQLRGLIFTPDGETVLSCGDDHSIHAWDPATGAVRYVLQGHSGAVNGLALSPDGRTLASVSSDKTCILWDLAAGQPRLTLRGHADRLNTVAFSPDGRSLATGSDDQTVRLWCAADGVPLGILEGHIDKVGSLAFGPDGRLASSSEDKTIRLWNPDGGQTLLILKGHAGRIRSIRFSPDGRTLASGSDDRTLKLWEAAPEAVLSAASGSPAPVSQGDDPARTPKGGVLPPR